MERAPATPVTTLKLVDQHDLCRVLLDGSTVTLRIDAGRRDLAEGIAEELRRQLHQGHLALSVERRPA
jgi:hypothetical protein